MPADILPSLTIVSCYLRREVLVAASAIAIAKEMAAYIEQVMDKRDVTIFFSEYDDFALLATGYLLFSSHRD